MTRFFTGLTLLFIFYSSLSAQQAFYKHFEGKVGSNINIVVDLVQSNERLSGYYYYFFDDISGDTSWTHYGKSMPISGSIKDGRIEFAEFNPEVKGALYSGELSNGSITGVWISSDGKKQLPLAMSENYPPGTMSFKAIYMADNGKLIEKTGSPVASIKLSLLIPLEFAAISVTDSVLANIYDHFFSLKSTDGNPESLLNNLKETYFSNYRKSNQDLYQEGASSFDWQKIKEVKILHNEKNILSLEYFDYGSTGGAHGLSFSNFHSFDLNDGHLINLEEIFRDDYRNDLRDIINSAARKKYSLERNQVMTQAGFFVEYLDPTTNFYITKDGIGFFYNQYEVAPFALGPVEIFVNYGDLLRILRENSPIYRLISSPN